MHKRFKYRYYFSNRLNRQLDQISDYPLTIVEAPSGFGKTTAVREYLKNKATPAACEYWYTCLGGTASAAWMGICELFSNVDVKVADDLRNLKMPTIDTLFYVRVILRSLNCQQETYLVIDNYQLVSCDIHHELISVFSMHENPKLHMIFITRQLEPRYQLSLHNDNIHTIKASAFFFDREDIAGLFRMEGLRLTGSELENIYISTEGWISAIRLYMINYKETGSCLCPAGIEQLVETAIWSRLSPKQQDFLLMVSVFDSFTARQAAAMLEYDTIPDKIERKLKTSNFIRYFPDEGLFMIHRILLGYLRNRFQHHQTEEYRNRVFYRAGVSCAAMKQYSLAAEFFYKVRDFEAILSMAFTRKYLDEQKEKFGKGLLVAIVSECPERTLCRYPFAMIILGYHGLLLGECETYRKLCRLLYLVIQRETDYTQEEIRKISGECILLESLGEFNDISRMQAGFKAAWEILGDSSDMVESSTPWLSVFTTTFGMFWRESGGLDQTLRVIDEIKPIYRKFNKGQAAGLSYVMQAEVMLMRGKDDDAEILCHKAFYEARSYRQDSICLYAELNLARIFILRGDAENFFAAIGNIQEYAKENTDLSIQRMVDLCMPAISLILGIKDYVASWLYDVESIKKLLYAPVLPFAQLLHLRLLLMDKQYNEFYAVSQIISGTLRNPDGQIEYLMLKMYYFIFLSAAKYNNGNDGEARGYLKEALDIALPDQIYLPFADHNYAVDLLASKSLPLSFAGAAGGVQNSGSISVLIDVCKRQGRGVSIIRKAAQQKKSPLTPREREVAYLAKDRRSSREIADKLYISQSTVKTILRSVYSKLDIHSRGELASKEF